ncbi:amidase [Methylobacterium crusticola]|nr:amidase [Methylobacterium crusticola]
MLRAREVSASEIARACLARIRRHDGHLNSFITVTEERALARAAQADAELARGVDRGPFHGIPYALKDNVDTAGILSSSHSRIFADRVPAEDAEVARRLAEAGGVLVGKTATFEFAIGGPAWDLPWPPARNPWNRDYLPGGSSSGSGAAVGAGFVPGAVGTDTGGSVRWPAAMCGVAGLKPTYGRVSRRGIHPNTYSLDHAGPLTRTVEDCALMLGAMAGHDPRDPGSIDVPVEDYAAALTGDVRGLRIGLVRHWYASDGHPEVVDAVDAAVAVLRSLGAAVEEIVLDPLQDYVDAKTTLSVSELYAVHEADLKTRPGEFGRHLRTRVIGGALIRAEDYIQAQRWRTELVTRAMAHFRRFDLLVTAGWLAPADPADPDGADFFRKRLLVTMPFSLTGMPALVVPCGLSSGGLPLSLQIGGRPFDEARVLRAGDAYQRATAWHHARPVLP